MKPYIVIDYAKRVSRKRLKASHKQKPKSKGVVKDNYQDFGLFAMFGFLAAAGQTYYILTEGRAKHA